MNRLVATFIVALGSFAVRAQTSDVVAVLDGKPISAAELDARMGDRLLRLKTEEYSFRRSMLQSYVEELILAREAAKRKITVAALVQSEISDHIQPVTEAEALAVIESGPPGQPTPTADTVRTTREQIRQRRIAKRRADLLAELRKQYAYVEMLEPPRAAGQYRGRNRRGAEGAPVSLVVFSDYQCPFCTKLETSLERVRKEYPAEVSLTFKQFPLPMHPQAIKAAEAALCAGEQGRFWELHDVLFAEQNLVSGEQFGELAKRAGLDVAAFEDCFQSHRVAGEWQQEKAEGMAAGITATPTMFLNGRLVTGAQPFESLKGMIDAELRLRKSPDVPSH